MSRALQIAALLVAGAAAGCVRQLGQPQLTGTCDGACAHYIECKPGHSELARTRCVAECPSVFSDRDSLLSYERLTCDDAVEFVDGKSPHTAGHAR